VKSKLADVFVLNVFLLPSMLGTIWSLELLIICRVEKKWKIDQICFWTNPY